MSAPIYIFVNGIWNLPSSSKEWQDQAVTWIQTRTAARAEKFEYYAMALTRRMFQARHAEALADLLWDYDHDPIVLVAHSNGADLALRALRERQPQIAELHLISAACEADFDKNGLNEAMRGGRVGSVHCYTAGQDRAMKLAQLSRTLGGWLGLGYGTLGLSGPQNVGLYQRNDVTNIWRDHYGHSDWFKKENFEGTLRLICPHAGPATDTTNTTNQRT